jgi:hypothetical protein
MLAPQPIENPTRRSDAAGLDIAQSALDTLDRLDTVEQRLVRRDVLDDEFRFSIDGQHERVTGRSQALKQIGGIPLEVAEGSDVIRQIEHLPSITKLALNVMLPRYGCRNQPGRPRR